MKTIALIAQKGGTGKTTLALCLAVAAEQDGLSTLIVDLDPQATACNWGDRRQSENPLVIDAQPARMPQALERARSGGINLVVIDTPARSEQAAYSTDVCHSIHGKIATQSTGSLPPNPEESCHPAHVNPATWTTGRLPPTSGEACHRRSSATPG